MLDAKIASALKKIITNPHIKRRVNLEYHKAQMQNRFLSGRPIAYMIYEYFRVTAAHEAVLDFTDLFSIALHGDDIQEIDTRWDHVLMSTSEVPNDRILESLCTRCECESLQNSKQYWLCANKKSIQVDRGPSYQQLKTMVNEHTGRKIRTRKFQARNKIETGVLVKAQKREECQR